MRPLIIVLTLLLAAGTTAAEQFIVATYNIENWRENFQAQTLQSTAATQPALDEPFMRRLQKEDDEDNWEVAQVISDPRFNPDILLIQEGCTQEQLEFFNTRWLNGAYETVRVFPSNTTRDQHLAIMLKPGFRVLEQRDHYHQELDTSDNPRGNRLFARGPVFVLVETPAGYRYWVGTNHQKSKSGNDVEITRWRTREAERTNQIINKLARTTDVPHVIFLGDFNDEIGYQEFELEAGADTMSTLVGHGDDKLYLATRELAESGAFTFGGYWDDRRRTFIDHIITTPELKDRLDEPVVVNWGLTPVASDHYPVMVRVRAN